MNIWYCNTCKLVHLRAGSSTVDLNMREFADFAESVVDVHYSSGWQMSQWALPMRAETDDVLNSETIG